MATSFSTATLNANGLRKDKDRRALFFWLKTLCIDIIFLQETHCHPEDVQNWKKEWGGDDESFWSTCSSNMKGVAVLFNCKLDYKIENMVIDRHARYLYFEFVIEGEKRFKMVNIYAPNDVLLREKFFEGMEKWIDLSDQNLVGGDYNCAQNFDLDRLNCVNEKNDEGRPYLHRFMSKFQLEDVWRRRYPDKLCYSFSRGNKKSRLDYWLVSKSLDSHIMKVWYEPCVFSDHDLAVATVKINEIKQGPGNWKMNSSTIESDLFNKCFCSFWEDWKTKKGNFASLGMWWDVGKIKIKELTIWCSKKLKQDNSRYQILLENRIKSLKDQENCDHDLLSRSEQLLKSHLISENEGNRIRSKVQWFEEGEQSTKFFHGIEKSKAKNKSFENILDKKGELKSGTDEIMKVQVEFYKDLYSSEGIDVSARDFFGQYITKTLSSEDLNIMNKNLDLEELTKAIGKMKKDKSPGPDGITPAFYKMFWNIIKHDLLEVFESCYVSEELTYSQYLALLVLLYKKGQREDIKNWRPISLSNTDVKILTKAFAERLRIVLPNLIDVDQTGCIKDRKIGHSIRLIDDIFHQMDDENIMLSTDREKAFDRVEFPWLFFVLEKFGFGQYFLNWMKILYKSLKSAVVTNGWTSTYFSLTRGIRQGDALSALLFIIQAEPLAEYFRLNQGIKGIDIKDEHGNAHELRGCQYVDDANNFLRNRFQVFRCLQKIELFGKASGSRINRGKTVALVSEHYRSMQSIDSQITAQTEVEKVLGVPIGKGKFLKCFWEKKIEGIKKKIDFWKVRDLSLIGKIHIVKSLLIPIVQYAASHILFDEKYVTCIQEMIWKFVWHWDCCLITKEMRFLPRKLGGLGMPDLGIIVKVYRIKMVIDIMRQKSRWNLIARQHILSFDKMFDINCFMLLTDRGTDIIKSSSIPLYYKECLLAFQEMNSKSMIPFSNPIIWCNSQFEFNKRSLSFKHWSKSGMKHLGDVVQYGRIDRQSLYEKLADSQRAGFYFEFSRLKRALLDCDNNNFSSIQLSDTGKPSFENLHYDIYGTNTPKNVFDLTSKDIYSILLDSKNINNKSESYWSNKFVTHDISFDILYENLLHSQIMPRKALVFNWRIFVGQVVTEKVMIKFGYSRGFCSICKVGFEDLDHLLVNCPSVKNVWEFIDQLFRSLSFPALNHFNRIVGIVNKKDKNDIRNVILSITRWQIWKRRCDIRYKKGFVPTISVTLKVKLALKWHFDILIKSKSKSHLFQKDVVLNILDLL